MGTPPMIRCLPLALPAALLTAALPGTALLGTALPAQEVQRWYVEFMSLT